MSMPAAELNMLARILVAVGGSDSSFSALSYALDLAHAARSCPTALIVEDVLLSPELFFARGQELSRIAEQLAASVQQAANETQRRVLELAGQRNMEIDIDRQTGRVGDCVVAAAADASLLILGRQGHYTRRSGLLGSNTEIILRRAHKPILVAPREYQRMKRVLVAYGGKDFGGLALETGWGIAETLRCPLEILTVADKPAVAEAIQERARSWHEKVRPRTTFLVEIGDPATAIIARSANDALVVMGAYGHSRLYHMVLGCVTEQVVRFAHGPVLLTAKQAGPAIQRTPFRRPEAGA